MNDTLNSLEQELIRGLKKGDLKAFDRIYKMYSSRLYAYSVQFTKSPEDSEEIVQDVFVRLWTNRENIRQEETLRSLLFIMAKHYLINAYRKKVNSLVFEEYVNCQEAISEDNGNQHLEYEEFILLLQRAMNKLPSTQQKVIELSKIKQLSNKEVAEELFLSEQTVKNQLSLGLKALMKELNRLPISLWMLFFIN
jgi:RNA polymerase sigma factor, sigma-70 family/RNA polymerase sigma-70 factor, Bacteroides expansion family 1